LQAGCTIIALMDQRERFEAFDFTNHIITAWEADTLDGQQQSSERVNLVDFVRVAKEKRAINESIFAVFDKYLRGPKWRVEVPFIHPPSADDDRETVV
jgi:hypothetical protein